MPDAAKVELPTAEVKRPDDRCETCRFWQPIDDTLGEHAQCRRYAPRASYQPVDKETLHTTTYLEWPETRPDDWCGEWKGKVAEKPIRPSMTVADVANVEGTSRWINSLHRAALEVIDEQDSCDPSLNADASGKLRLRRAMSLPISTFADWDESRWREVPGVGVGRVGKIMQFIKKNT